MRSFLAALLVSAVSAFAGESVLVIAKVHPKASEQTVEMPYAIGGKVLTLNVDKTPALTEADVAKATSVLTDEGHLVDVVFTPEGAEKFRKLTAESAGNMIAIVVDGKVVMAPGVTGELKGENVVINGYFSPTEADELAARLKAGK